MDGPWVSCLELCKFRDVKRSQWYLCKTIECLCFPLLDRKTLFEIMVMTIPAITVSIGQVCHGLDGPSRTQFILAHDGTAAHLGLSRLPWPLPGPRMWINVRFLVKLSSEANGWLEYCAIRQLFRRSLSSSNSLTLKFAS